MYPLHIADVCTEDGRGMRGEATPPWSKYQGGSARNWEVFITQRGLRLAKLVAIVLRRSESPGQQDASWGARVFLPRSALQFDENCRLSGRLGAILRTRMGIGKPLRTQPRNTSAKSSFRSLNLPPILARGFARRAFRLFAPARFLQGFCELQERTESGICARPAKCCWEIPQKHGNTAMRLLIRLGKRV